MSTFQKPYDIPKPICPAAVMIDWENVAGISEKSLARIIARLKLNVRISIAKAYADWKVCGTQTSALARLGLELVQTSSSGSGKNSADLKLTVDAVELIFTYPWIKTLVLFSGDRDFVPLIQFARRRGLTVWCLGDRGFYEPNIKG